MLDNDSALLIDSCSSTTTTYSYTVNPIGYAAFLAKVYSTGLCMAEFFTVNTMKRGYRISSTRSKGIQLMKDLSGVAKEGQFNQTEQLLYYVSLGLDCFGYQHYINSEYFDARVRIEPTLLGYVVRSHVDDFGDEREHFTKLITWFQSTFSTVITP